MNLGIVIAVSDYNGDANPLAACAADGNVMNDLLVSSGQFDDVLYISNNKTSSEIKGRLVDFAKLHANDDVDQLVFYFTGHGLFEDSEFYYLLPDFRRKAKRQTSIQNTELDGILRSMKPKLAVKIVDACQSGISYIKDVADVSSYIQKGDVGYNKLYFMFSSTSEQSSYQDRSMSFFTRSLVEAVSQNVTNGVRYKDIIDYVSDDFSANGQQTPIFVAQADFTDIFVSVNQDLQTRLKSHLAGVPRAPASGTKAGSTLLERVQADASRYLSKPAVTSLVERLPGLLIERISPRTDITDLYTIEVSKDDTPPPNAISIGEWLAKPADDSALFAKATYKLDSYEARVPKGGSFGNTLVSRFLYDEDDDQYFKTVTKTRRLVNGFEYTTEMPFSMARVRLEPKFANLTPEECYLVPMVSQTQLRVFYAFCHFQITDWEKSQRVGPVSWKTTDCSLSDATAVEEAIRGIGERFAEFAIEQISTRFGDQPSGVKDVVEAPKEGAPAAAKKGK